MIMTPFRSEVTAVVDDTDGRKYAEIELTEDFLRTAGRHAKALAGWEPASEHRVPRTQKRYDLSPLPLLEARVRENMSLWRSAYTAGSSTPAG